MREDYWDYVDHELHDEYLRQKLIYRFKKAQIKKQMMYN